MRFYISAKWELKDLVAKMQEYLINKGYVITADWTKRAYARSYDENIKQSSTYSSEELKAILDSDVFIHLSNLSGKGKYIDLGIALASNYFKDKPFIYVIGKKSK